MFAESIHSVADTVNQIILAFGLHKSAKVSIKMNKNLATLSFCSRHIRSKINYKISLLSYCAHAIICYHRTRDCA